MDISVIISKMGTFVVLLVIGYVFAKLKITGTEFNRACSKLVMNLFLPTMILGSVINKEMAMTGSELIFGTVMMFVMFAINLAIGFSASMLRGLKDGDRAMHRILMCYMNNSFMGLPIVGAMYGADAVFFASMLNIPFNLTLYTLGVSQLQKTDGVSGFNLRSILTLPLISTVLAAIIFFSKPVIPFFIEDTISTISTATVPMSMLVVGSTLGNVSIGEAFRDINIYKMSFVRLIVCPLIVWLALRSFMPDRVMFGSIVILAAMPMAVVATPLGIENGRDGVESSKCIFVSTLLSVLTIPLMIYLLKL